MDEVPLRFEGRPARLRAEGRAGRTVFFAHPFPLDGSCWDDLMPECAALEKGPEVVTAPLAERALAPGSPLVERNRRLARGATPQGVAEALRGMALRPDSLADLPRWPARTVVMRGEQDQIVPRAASEALERGIPGARRAIIAGAGHLAFLEKPQEVLAELRWLLS